MEVLRAERVPFGVSVSFRLRDAHTPTGLTINTPEGLQAELSDYQSPSLYLVPNVEAIPVRHVASGVAASDIVGCDTPGAVVTYCETLDEEGECTRFLSVWCPAPAAV